MRKLLLVILLIALYHNGVNAEQKCLAAGNSAPDCAVLRM